MYHWSGAGKHLDCGFKADEFAATAIKSALSSAESTVSDLYHAYMTEGALGNKVDSDSLSKNLMAALKLDDGVASHSMAYQV